MPTDSQPRFRVVGSDPAPPGRLLRPIVLVGLMGAGKTAVGRRLAATLGVAFADADEAIIEAAGMSIPDIFEVYGETAFRDLERRVVVRLLDEATGVLALGGGAFIDPQTRAAVGERGISIWLKAELETLVARVTRKRAVRPLLMQGEPRTILAGLMERRYPIYAEADFTVLTGDQPLDEVVDRLTELLQREGLIRDVA
ncbi:MAG: shikimate kinase [Geminicoccaceae bacterium]